MIEPREIGPLFIDGAVIDAALTAAAQAAVREARMLGRPLVVWQDGRVSSCHRKCFRPQPRQAMGAKRLRDSFAHCARHLW